ncbi:MAG: STAS domain-containing protein [Pseudonocardiaceae bacterium]
MEHTAEQTITILRGGADYARVTLWGPLDHHAAQRLQSQLNTVLDTGARYLTVDLSNVTYCDEDVLHVLGWVARRAASQQGWLALSGVDRHIRFAAQ